MEFKVKYITDSNDKGVYLTDSDMHLLLFLYEQRLLAQTQLYEFYKLFHQPMTYNAFCNRLARLDEHKIIRRTRYELVRKSGLFLYLVEISPIGTELLYNAGYLNKKIWNKAAKTNVEHTLGIKQSVLEAFKIKANQQGYLLGGGGEYLYIFDPERIEREILSTGLSTRQKALKLYKNDDIGQNPLTPRERSENALLERREGILISYSYTDYRREIEEQIRADENKTDEIKKKEIEEIRKLVPDWILKQNTNTYDIEFDTGTEKVSTIQNKIENYISLNRIDKQDHTVLFISLDNSITTRTVSDIQTARLSDIKRQLMIETSLRDENLNVYVFPLERTSAVMQRLLNGTYIGEKRAITLFYNQVKTQYNVKPTNMEILKKLGVYRIQFDDYRISYALYVEQKEPFLILPFYLKEGDIRSMDKFCYFIEKVYALELPYGTRVVGIYETKEEMENDIQRIEVDNYHQVVLLYNLEDGMFYDAVTKELETLKPSVIE
jgi:hypothetical protein